MIKLRHAVVAMKVAISRSSIFSKWDKLLDYYYEKKTFKKKNGYDLNLKNPQTFNEKVVRKKLYDRNPLLYITGDKLRVKDFLKEKLGSAIAKEITIPTLYFGSDLEDIPFDSLPDEYIIKGCHLSGYNLIITKKSKLTRREILNHCEFLLKK